RMAPREADAHLGLGGVLLRTENYDGELAAYEELVRIAPGNAQAYEAINLLSEGSKGKAHFFVLDQFVKHKSSPTSLIPNGTPATEIVEYDEKYKKLITYILDNVYIAENNSIDEFPDDVIAITKNGKITRRQFSFSGGSVGLFEGKRIGRAKNLEKLSDTIKSLNKKLEVTNNKLSEKTKELEELKKSSHGNQLEYIRDEVNKINQEYISIKTKQEQFASMLDSNINKREDIEEKLLVLREELEELQPRYEDLKLSLESNEEEYLLIKDEVEAKTELLSQRSNAFNQENILFHQQQNKVSSINQEISFKQANFDSSKERVEKNSTILKETEEEVRQLIQTSETNDDELVAMYDEKESIEKGVNEAERDYYEVRGNIDEIDKEVREIQGSRENIDSFLMEITNKLNDSKMQLNSVKERLSVEFDVNLDELLRDNESEEEKAEKEEFTEQELTAKVEKIKSRLDNMGPINPMAMEAYQEIKERHDFIIGQKEDLLKAKESLLTTIGEIDEVARVTFMEAFDKIKANFIKVFRSLFTEEDDCDLRLSDPEHPLESSIDIMAKPKGKRPLTINQLSGGEKTLTATSLLFAIYLIKPAPFCIFDEVDAPLDDANIDKFNNIIRTFSKDSQFIIVTHNKRTMASTDIMYGVTMLEQGVSSVIPTDLRGLEQ
ncbi:MAG: chromosome segregation protein SMC, partial [Bacteroidota bacterium]